MRWMDPFSKCSRDVAFPFGLGALALTSLVTTWLLVSCQSSEEAPAEEPVSAEEPIAAEAPAPEAEVVATPPSSVGTGVVRYVQVDKIEIRANPDAASPTVGELRQGDYVFVVGQGEWAQLARGGYVPMTALTEKAIPRKRHKAEWR